MKFGGHRTSAVIGEGGFARVYRATSPVGTEVALKVALPSDVEPDALPRMRREISVQSGLEHPNVMVILASNPDEGWFTMPLAEGSLDNLIVSGKVHAPDEALAVDVVTSLLDGLADAHEQGIVHRDVNPGNTLGLRDAEGLRWVVADWGILRRPRGATTVPRTVKGGNALGTLGYAAPELWTAAHEADTSADVYSVARVAARLLTGQTPLMTAPLRPTGVWRTWVDECTQHDPARRPRTAAEAKALLTEVLETPTGGPLAQLTARVDAAPKDGVSDATWRLALRHREDFAALEVITAAPLNEVRAWAQREPADASALGQAICAEIAAGWGDDRAFARYDKPLRWVLAVLRSLDAATYPDQLQDLATAYFSAERSADRWGIRDETVRWLCQLRGPADAPVAHALTATRLGTHYADYIEGRVHSRAIIGALGL